MQNNSPRTLIPLTKWNEYHAFPSVSSLRHLIFFEEQNGFSKAIRRIGKRIYIDEQSFFEWVDAQNKN
jgi:hypothetical protein